MRSTRIVILHGADYFNVGDLGIVDATMLRLREELGDVEFRLVDPYARLGEHWRKRHGSALRGFEQPLGGADEIRDFFQFPVSTVGRSVAVAKFAWLWVSAKLRERTGLYLPGSNFLRELAWGDLLISRGGGFLVDDGTGAIVRPHLLTLSLACATGKPVIVYAQSIGPFARWISAHLTRSVLNHTKLVLVRDPMSLETLQKPRLQGPRVELTGDEAFLLPMLLDDERQMSLRTAGIDETVGPRIGVTVVPWHFPKAHDPGRLRDRYIAALVDVVDWLIETHGATIYLVANVEAPHGESDRTFIEDALVPRLHRVDKVHIVPPLSARALKTVLGTMQLVVGTRMHSNIFALSAGVPTLAIAYLPKTTGIMHMLDLDDFVLSIERLDANIMRERLTYLLTHYDEVRRRIAIGTARMRDAARQNGALVREFVESNVRTVLP